MGDGGAWIGFLSLNQTENKDGYVGALLLTDHLGRPIEFRVTYPVKPTQVQRRLYGATLEPYIGVELCGKQLIGALEHEPNLLAVNLGYLVQIRPDCEWPVVHIQRVGEAMEVRTTDTGILGAVKITSSTERYQPVQIRVADGFAADLDNARPLLEDIFGYFDLLEPFDRIKSALQVLASQDKRFV